MQQVFRFAPSPNGRLHLGHASSALLNAALAREAGGRFLLRIEDIDVVRCRPELIDAVFDDLHWLGLEWEEPVLRQSSQFARYGQALATLSARELVYPCFCTRTDLRRAAEAVGADAPRDPDGALRYPGTCRHLPEAERQRRLADGVPHALRLDSAKALAVVEATAAPLSWQEWGKGRIAADADVWGDVILGRKEVPTSYHLAVVLDDAMQGVTDVVRGQDLFAATGVHRVLQVLLGLPEPRYRHHTLLRDADGQKLAKSRSSTSIFQLRRDGFTAAEVRALAGYG